MIAVTGGRNEGRGGDGVRLFSQDKRGRRRGGSTVPKVGDTSKSGAAVRKVDGSD
jgi:hypothetical protein